MPLGTYPKTTLKIARKKAAEVRDQIAQKINPMDAIRERSKPVENERTFKAIALKWWEIQSPKWSKEHARKIKKQWLERDCKLIANIEITDIDAGHITEVTQAIDSAGHGKSASPILAVINRIFGYALANRLTRSNPAAGFPLVTSHAISVILCRPISGEIKGFIPH